MKNLLKLIALLAVASALVYAIISSNQENKGEVCTNVNVTIQDSMKMGLVSKEDVLNILSKGNIKLKGEQIDKINQVRITQLLCKNAYIDTARCYHTPGGNMCIEVIAKQPILHVMLEDGNEYYLDRKGSEIPVKDHNANINIATGNFNLQFAKQKLAPMAAYIQSDPFWQPLVQQIDVKSGTDIEIYTRLGDHVIKIGEPVDIEKKFKKLRVFYEQGLSKMGWNKYKIIDVSYRGIVVATKEGEEVPIEQPVAKPEEATADQGDETSTQDATAATTEEKKPEGEQAPSTEPTTTAPPAEAETTTDAKAKQ